MQPVSPEVLTFLRHQTRWALVLKKRAYTKNINTLKRLLEDGTLPAEVRLRYVALLNEFQSKKAGLGPIEKEISGLMDELEGRAATN